MSKKRFFKVLSLLALSPTIFQTTFCVPLFGGSGQSKGSHTSSGAKTAPIHPAGHNGPGFSAGPPNPAAFGPTSGGFSFGPPHGMPGGFPGQPGGFGRNPFGGQQLQPQHTPPEEPSYLREFNKPPVPLPPGSDPGLGDGFGPPPGQPKNQLFAQPPPAVNRPGAHTSPALGSAHPSSAAFTTASGRSRQPNPKQFHNPFQDGRPKPKTPLTQSPLRTKSQSKLQHPTLPRAASPLKAPSEPGVPDPPTPTFNVPSDSTSPVTPRRRPQTPAGPEIPPPSPLKDPNSPSPRMPSPNPSPKPAGPPSPSRSSSPPVRPPTPRSPQSSLAQPPEPLDTVIPSVLTSPESKSPASPQPGTPEANTFVHHLSPDSDRPPSPPKSPQGPRVPPSHPRANSPSDSMDEEGEGRHSLGQKIKDRSPTPLRPRPKAKGHGEPKSFRSSAPVKSRPRPSAPTTPATMPAMSTSSPPPQRPGTPVFPLTPGKSQLVTVQLPGPDGRTTPVMLEVRFPAQDMGQLPPEIDEERPPPPKPLAMERSTKPQKPEPKYQAPAQPPAAPPKEKTPPRSRWDKSKPPLEPIHVPPPPPETAETSAQTTDRLRKQPPVPPLQLPPQPNLPPGTPVFTYSRVVLPSGDNTDPSSVDGSESSTPVAPSPPASSDQTHTPPSVQRVLRANTPFPRPPVQQPNAPGDVQAPGYGDTPMSPVDGFTGSFPIGRLGPSASNSSTESDDDDTSRPPDDNGSGRGGDGGGGGDPDPGKGGGGGPPDPKKPTNSPDGKRSRDFNPSSRKKKHRQTTFDKILTSKKTAIGAGAVSVAGLVMILAGAHKSPPDPLDELWEQERTAQIKRWLKLGGTATLLAGFVALLIRHQVKNSK